MYKSSHSLQDADHVVPPPVREPQVTLAGIAITREARKALLVSADGADSTWVQEGETVEGWRLEGVTDSGVTLTNDQRRLQLMLYAASQ